MEFVEQMTRRINIVSGMFAAEFSPMETESA
jgi:hypothetical protein